MVKKKNISNAEKKSFSLFWDLFHVIDDHISTPEALLPYCVKSASKLYQNKT
jgi:hypothetical protein